MRRFNDHSADSDAGVTLVEVLVGIVVLALVTGAITTAMISAVKTSENASARTKESNDAQIMASFLARDAQAAGGVNPAAAAVDATLGVSLGDPAECGAAGLSLIARFKWADRTITSGGVVSAPAATTRIATYFFDSAAGTIVRQACSRPPASGSFGVDNVSVLAREVAATPAPSAACVPQADCSGVPTAISLTATEQNDPVSASSPYNYTLTAAIRPDVQVPPSGNSTDSAALIALGSGAGCSGNSGTGIDISGNADLVVVVGSAIVNAGNSGSCTAIRLNGNGATFAVNDGTLAVRGTCSTTGGTCPTGAQYVDPIVDPLAGLPAPAVSCGAGANPAPIAGVYQPGTYPQAVTVNGAGVTTFASGIYVFCAGVDIRSAVASAPGGVLFYVASGSFGVSNNAQVTLSAQTSGLYQGVAVWQAASNTNLMSLNRGSAAMDVNGIVYAPGATVDLRGTSSLSITSVIAARIVISGSGTVDVGV